MGQQTVVKVSIIALVLGLVLGFAGGYAYKNLNADGGVAGSSGAPGTVIFGNNFEDGKNVYYSETRVAVDNKEPYTCKPGWHVDNTGFFTVQLTTAIEYDGDPVLNGKKHHAVNNPNYPGDRFVGYDKIYRPTARGNAETGWFVEAILTSKTKKVLTEPTKMYQANVGRFSKGGARLYLGADVVKPLVNGGSVKLDEDPIPLCSKPGRNGGGGTGE